MLILVHINKDEFNAAKSQKDFIYRHHEGINPVPHAVRERFI